MKFKNIATILTLSLITSLGIVGCNSSDTKNKDSESQEAVELNISAAASLKEAMEKIEEEYKKVNENVTLVVNYGASGSLQQQIEQGAPCDVFISAGQKQMKALDEASLLLEGTYKDLLENDLVLIASKDSDVSNLDDLITNKVKHIAVGEPSSVPAGKYADEVLVNLDLKDKIKDKLVFAKDVKEVLAWTQSGNAEVGFVYYSDTINTDNIKIVETTPSTSHSAIVYPIAVIKESKKPEAAKEFEDFLLSTDGQAILKDFGYKSVE
ncbi:MAG: molybdate ABC transporter substrate-binding protein [Peptostreptococcaceae bacterium]|nr:molybdate ABC transporter substrate-binding protein [Peptostreptococcaceae bacterium]